MARRQEPPPVALPRWPADQVERRSLSALIPYARNARTHSDEQVGQIAGSIREWGFTVPILVDEDNTLIAGHGRVLAAHRLGLTEVPIVVARGWTDAQKRAYRIADNKLALNSGWDEELLGLEISDLRELGTDFGLIGFTAAEITELLGAVDTVRLPDLPNGERNPFQEMTFILHDDQVEVVKEALRLAKARGPFDGPNENSNGNALARVCEAFGDCSAKALHVAPIAAEDANRFVRKHHYSGKVVPNSQLHFGVFLDHRLEGVLQFGPSLDKRKLQGLVAGTPWNDFIELNRLVLTERLPRNSESRAISVAFRMMRKEYPQMQWVVSFADGTQCGDGTIYRAAGFVLTGIRRNTSIWRAPTGATATNLALREATIHKVTVTNGAGQVSASNGSASMRRFIDAGYRPLAGYQLRYVYFLDPTARARLTVPELPFSAIAETGAGMYRGQARGKQATAEFPSASGGAAPTAALPPADGGLAAA